MVSFFVKNPIIDNDKIIYAFPLWCHMHNLQKKNLIYSK